MYTYFFISLIIIMVLYLVKSKTIESLVSEPVTITDPDKDEKDSLLLGKENNEKTTDIYGKSTYLTANKINYNLLDSKIDMLKQQYNALNYNYNNFQFQLGQIVTGTNPNDDINMNIGGSFPGNVKLSFYFPPPLPGIPGEKGEQGEIGGMGQTGPEGKQGKNGPFGSCPK